LRDGLPQLNLFNALGMRLEAQLERRLDSLTGEIGRSKSYYAGEAIRRSLVDQEDYLKGIAALERREPTSAPDELERRLGFAEGVSPGRFRRGGRRVRACPPMAGGLRSPAPRKSDHQTGKPGPEGDRALPV
jgi:predicted DNA-binding protein